MNEPTTQINIDTEQDNPIVSTPKDEPIPASRGSMKSVIAVILGGLATLSPSFFAIFKDNPQVALHTIYITGGLTAIYLIRQIVLDYLRIKVAADPAKHNAK